MRSARVLLILFFLATSSTAVAATKVIKFGKLIKGTHSRIPKLTQTLGVAIPLAQ